jgi:hypothetical protein
MSEPHHNYHVERRNREWIQRTELSPREIDFIRTWHANQTVSMQRLASLLGIAPVTAYQLRDACIEVGAVASTGYGCTRRLTLTAMGREALAHGTTPEALRSGDPETHDEGAAQGRAESCAREPETDRRDSRSARRGAIGV